MLSISSGCGCACSAITAIPTSKFRSHKYARRAWLKARAAILIASVSILGFDFIATSFGDQVILSAGKDNTLYENAGGTVSNGGGRRFFAGKTEQNRIRRGVIAFDLSSIPLGSTIDSATLTLYMSRTTAFDHNVTLHRLTADWGEGTSMASGPEGMGAPSTTGDATWIHRFYPTSNWSVTGGDFVGAASASTVVGNAIAYYNWSSAGMVADLQMWLNSPSTNFGWLIKGDESVIHTAKRFESRQSTIMNQRPALTITYTPPSTSGACCFMDGGCQVLFEAVCGSQSGIYQGNGSVCTPNPCRQPTGACCFNDGSCSFLTTTDCALQSGVYQGANTSCTPGLCPIVTGACCFNDATCQSLTPVACANQAGIYQGDNTVCVPNLCSFVLTPFVDPLPIPEVAQPITGVPGGTAYYEIAIRQFEQKLHQELPPTTLWGYGYGPESASYPGPTIEASTGEPVTVKWINDLRDEKGDFRTTHYLPVDLCAHGATDEPRVVVHFHGGHVAAEYDGHPDDTFLPGSFDTYIYPNNQQSATLWYHDHALGITRLNVYMGLAGLYVLRDPSENGLALPSGEYEVPLIIQDRSFNSDGSLKYLHMWHEHFFGDNILVNGKVWPFLTVKQGKYRFRVLNASNAHTFTMSLSNDSSFLIIGSDGGLLTGPAIVSNVSLGPGERAAIVIDFESYTPGTEIILTNTASAPYPGIPGDGVVPNVMKFIVQGTPGHTAPIPGVLRPISPLLEQDANLSRDLELQKFTSSCTEDIWLINGLGFHDIVKIPLLGSTEIWRFINRSGVSHPLHLHMTMFQVLDRQEFEIIDDQIVLIGSPMPPRPHETAWKDTVQVDPNQVVRVITRFEDYTGVFPYHCHILEHEDNEMMRQYEVVECLVNSDCNDDDVCTLDRCMPDRSCLNDASQCDDGDSCTENDVCDMMGACAGSQIVRLYGDVDPSPNGDGIVNLDDILCVLSGFGALSNCPLADLKPCRPNGNGIVNLDDMLAVLSAFTGSFGCPHPCPP